MVLSIEDFQWTREPESCVIKGVDSHSTSSGQDSSPTVEVVTKPHTDLWQRTYYHFQNDNAPVFQMKTKEKFFSYPEMGNCVYEIVNGK